MRRILLAPHNVWGKVWMRLFGIRVPASCKIVGAPILWGNQGEVVLGENVRLFSKHAYYGFGWSFPACFVSTGPNGRIEIGEESEIYSSAIFAASSITIGKRVFVAADCRIADHDGHDPDSIPRIAANSYDGKPIVIGDDVWLGCGVTVLKGVTIGSGTVVATQSVVVDDLPPNVIAAGVPARVIRPLRLEDR